MNPFSKTYLHIVSFDVPYPADYGGVIDVFYKIKALHKMGVNIILHCFEYGRGRPDALNNYCYKTYYYPRKIGWQSQISPRPYIVNSRTHKTLLERLAADPYPIIFEGLHTTAYIKHPALAKKMKIYRESNIEHQYYYHLAQASQNFSEKVFFLLEALRLRFYQPRLKYAQVMLAVSKADTTYLCTKFPDKKVIYLPSFHGHEMVNIAEGRGDYALFHGNLSVPENQAAFKFLLEKVFNGLDYPLVVAGKNPSPSLIQLIERTPHVRLVANPDQTTMENLIREAHIHVLYTFQPTGLKLKLLNTLYQGRHCLVNPHMIAGTELAPLCHVAHSPEEFRRIIVKLAQIPMSKEDIQKRENFFRFKYNDEQGAQLLMTLIQ